MSEVTQVIAEPISKLAVIVKNGGLSQTSAAALIETFQPLWLEADSLCRKADGIEVTDATQVSEIRKARELRLGIRSVRIQTEKQRKQFKEDSLRTGKTIDAIANVIKDVIEPVEQKLQEQEDFAARAEEARKIVRLGEREAALKPFGVDTTFIDLKEMPEPAFTQLLANTRVAHESKIASAKKAEEERIAAEKARTEEDARVRAENARLKKEADEREAAAKTEREKLEAKAKSEREAAEAVARKEREAREKAERELEASRLEVAARVAAEIKAREAAELAPDKEKLCVVANALATINVPSLKTPKAKATAQQLESRIQALVAWLMAEIK